MVKLWDETMTEKPISPYLRDHPIRELCKCKRGPVNPEYETCEHCYLDAQANIIDLEDERRLREHEKIMEGRDER